MDNVIIVAIITVMSQLIIFAGQKLYDKKKEKQTIKTLETEADKNVSEKRKLDGEVLDKLNASVEELTTQYLTTNQRYVDSLTAMEVFKHETNKELDHLRNELDILKTENVVLKKSNEGLENSVWKLQQENIDLKLESLELRKKIESAQVENRKLIHGISILIAQLREIPVEPKWLPSETKL